MRYLSPTCQSYCQSSNPLCRSTLRALSLLRPPKRCAFQRQTDERCICWISCKPGSVNNLKCRLMLTVEVAKKKIAIKQLKCILTNLPDISVSNTKLHRGLNGKSMKHKNIVTNKGLKFNMCDNFKFQTFIGF